MACGCAGRNGGQAESAQFAASAGTYRVRVNDRQVYESSSKDAADAVASRFDNAEILAPGEPNPV